LMPLRMNPAASMLSEAAKTTLCSMTATSTMRTDPAMIHRRRRIPRAS
jgi:hypothetical protein